MLTFPKKWILPKFYSSPLFFPLKCPSLYLPKNAIKRAAILMMSPSLPSAVKKGLKTSNFIKKFKFRPATSVKPSVLVCGWEVPSLLKDRKSWADAHVQFHKKSHCCPPKKEILLQKNKKYTSSNSHFPPPLPFSQFCRVIPPPHFYSFPI